MSGVVRFVIFAPPRSGSTLLALTLRFHPNIRMFGELLNDDESERKRSIQMGFSSELENGSATQLASLDSIALLHNLIFAENQPCNTIAVGYKFLYCQAFENKESKKAWEYICAKPDVYIIQLTRKNLFAAFVSLKLAQATGKWTCFDKAENAETKPRIELDFKACRQYFKSSLRIRKNAEEALGGHHVLSLEYECDLYRQFDYTINRTQKFLGVEPLYLPKALGKQLLKPPSEYVINYSKLKTYFKDTEFDSFFNL